MTLIGTLRSFNRDVLATAWVRYVLTILACVMTFSIMSGPAMPLWLAVTAAVVDVTVIVTAIYSWSHRSRTVRRLLYGKPRPVERDDFLALLLAAEKEPSAAPLPRTPLFVEAIVPALAQSTEIGRDVVDYDEAVPVDVDADHDDS